MKRKGASSAKDRAGRRGAARDGQKADRKVTVQVDDLRARLEEAEATLSAIRGGEVDALVISGAAGDQVYTLQGAETPYRVLVEQMQEGAVTLAENGTILYGNQCFADLVGVPLEQTIGTPLTRYAASGDSAALRRLLADARRRTARREFALRRPDGRPVDALLTASALPDDEANRICLIVTDLTEHKEKARLLAERTAELERSNEALRLAERLAALGTLASGLGHDMGNMLLPIRMRLDALDGGPLSPELHSDVAAIRKCTEHLQRLVNGVRLLSLDPESSAPPEGIRLRDCWPDAEAVVRTVLTSQIALETDFAPDLPAVPLARQSLVQVIFNFVHNAADALGGAAGGRVRLRGSVDSDGSVRIGVTDNGPGMTAEVRRRCLEPFFTTKVRRFNTGLGLALVHSIVRRAGGRLEIESAPRRGCTISIVLPPCAAAMHDIAIKPTAAVSVENHRTRAFIISCLTSVGLRITDDQAQTPGDAALWIATATPSVTRRARNIVEANDGCRVVLLDAHPGKPPHPRIVPLPPGTPLTATRTALQTVAAHLCGRLP